MSGINYPIQGVTSYGSVGLSRVEQYSGRTPVWVELLGVCASNVKDFDNLIASCAFFSINDKYNLTYGTFVEKILDEYRMSRTLHHVTFIHPFIWDEFGNGFTRATVAGKDIHWLMVLPISDMELKYLKKQGIDALENLFAEKQIDVYDINRPSAI
ncbi:MAG: suppressor of fused domain protein [Bauldia sp.]|nr:suppressor of fused domain protein [Bauldia sp.]